MENAVRDAKKAAVLLASECKMTVIAYEDEYLNQETTHTLRDAIENDFEDEEVNFSEENQDDECGGMDEAHAVQVVEDLAILKLKKNRTSSFPTYTQSNESGTKSSHSYSSTITAKKYVKSLSRV